MRPCMNLHAIVGTGVLKNPRYRDGVPALRRYSLHVLYAIEAIANVSLIAKVSFY